MKFNINDRVKVRLTDFGRQHLRQFHYELFKNYSDQFPYQPKEEVDGWAEFQMHELFLKFGACFKSIDSQLPFETEIEIPTDDGMDVALMEMKSRLGVQGMGTSRLLQNLGVSEETVEEWKVKGILVEELLKRLRLPGKGKLVESDYKQEI